MRADYQHHARETAIKLVMEDFEEPVKRIAEALCRERQAIVEDVAQWLDREAKSLRRSGANERAMLVEQLAQAHLARFPTGPATGE
jgi:signal transduction protein with GAF and PtsI domain